MNRARHLTGSTSLFACLLLLLPAAPLRAQGLEQQVAPLLQLAEASQLPQVYEVANQVADLAPDTNTDSFRGAVVRAVAAGGEGSGKSRLAAALAISTLKNDYTYGKDVFALLQPVVVSKDDELRAASLALLGEERLFSAKLLPDVRKVVVSNCKDELMPPLVR